MSTTQPTRVRRLTRDRFLAEFGERWEGAGSAEHGQHVSLIGPTGQGKTTTARQILARRGGRTLIVQVKGPDRAMRGFGHRIGKWPPPPLSTPRPRRGEPWVLRLEPAIKSRDDLEKMRGYFVKALRSVFANGRWNVYVDELQVTADPRMMGLGKQLEELLIIGRGRGISMMSSIQAPRWAPRAAYDQAGHVLLWRQRDKPALKRIDEIGGIDAGAVEHAVRTLSRYEFVWVDAIADTHVIVSAD